MPRKKLSVGRNPGSGVTQCRGKEVEIYSVQRVADWGGFLSTDKLRLRLLKHNLLNTPVELCYIGLCLLRLYTAVDLPSCMSSWGFVYTDLSLVYTSELSYKYYLIYSCIDSFIVKRKFTKMHTFFAQIWCCLEILEPMAIRILLYNWKKWSTWMSLYVSFQSFFRQLLEIPHATQ